MDANTLLQFVRRLDSLETKVSELTTALVAQKDRADNAVQAAADAKKMAGFAMQVARDKVIKSKSTKGQQVLPL